MIGATPSGADFLLHLFQAALASCLWGPLRLWRACCFCFSFAHRALCAAAILARAAAESLRRGRRPRLPAAVLLPTRRRPE